MTLIKPVSHGWSGLAFLASAVGYPVNGAQPAIEVIERELQWYRSVEFNSESELMREMH